MKDKGLLILGFLAAFSVGAYAASDDIGARRGPASMLTYRHEGDTPRMLAITCANSAWTVLVSSEPTRRAALFIANAGNTDGVCISTITAAGEACDDVRPGVELEPTGSFTDYGPTAWYCRSRSGNTDVIRGYWSFHSHDKP